MKATGDGRKSTKCHRCNEHVPEIESFIRAVRVLLPATINTLPFEEYPD